MPIKLPSMVQSHKVNRHLFSRGYSQCGAALGIEARCAAIGASRFRTVPAKHGARLIRQTRGGISFAWQSGTLARAKELGRGGRWKRKRLSFPLAHCWPHVGPCCVGMALLMADHICAENARRGKLGRQDVGVQLFTAPYVGAEQTAMRGAARACYH